MVANGMRPALAGQAALVTGGSSGIGAGIVDAFSAAGAMVAINFNSRGDEAEAAARRIEAAGGRAFAVGADVADEAAVEAMVAQVVERFGRLDVYLRRQCGPAAGRGLRGDGGLPGGYLSQEDRATLDNFLRRGGGIVSFHDVLCGPNPEEFAGFVGGAKKHGEVNYTLEADVPYTVVDTAHPIMKGVTNFSLKDEAFFNMTWSKQPEIHVLATAVMAKTPSADVPARSCRRSGRTKRACCPARRRSARSCGCRDQLRELLRRPGAADVAARDRVGRQTASGRAGDRTPAARGRGGRGRSGQF